MGASTRASINAGSERQAQARVVGLLHQALLNVEIVTDFKLSNQSPCLVDITIPAARLAIEIKRGPEPRALRQAEEEMARLAAAGWTAVLVFSGETEAAVREVVQHVHLVLRG